MPMRAVEQQTKEATEKRRLLGATIVTNLTSTKLSEYGIGLLEAAMEREVGTWESVHK